jgi:hypothetical protein
VEIGNGAISVKNCAKALKSGLQGTEFELFGEGFADYQ